MRKSYLLYMLLVLLGVSLVSGCAVGFYKGRPSDMAKIEELKDELSRLREAKSLLEDRLRGELESSQVSVSLEDRGLVITMMAEVLFDSGKAEISTGGEKILGKVARVIRDEDMLNNEIGIEGHTDDQPIKHSGWKSNWELSTARATNVLHFLIDTGGLTPEKLSATGYGEYRPIKPNSTPEGRQKNRRVEIIIKPMNVNKEVVKSTKGNAGYIK